MQIEGITGETFVSNLDAVADDEDDVEAGKNKEKIIKQLPPHSRLTQHKQGQKITN